MKSIICFFIIYSIKIISCICDCEIKKNYKNKCFSKIFLNEKYRDNDKSLKHCIHCHNSNSSISDDEKDEDKKDEDDKQNISKFDLSQFCDFSNLKKKNELIDFHPQHQCDVKNIEIILFNIYKSISDIIKNKIYTIDDKIISNLVNKDEKLFYQIKSDLDKNLKLIETDILESKSNLNNNIKDIIKENMDNLHNECLKLFDNIQNPNDLINNLNDIKSLSDEAILEHIKSIDSTSDMINSINKDFVQNLEKLFAKNIIDLFDLIKIQIKNTSNLLINDINNKFNNLNEKLKTNVLNNKKQIKKNMNTFNEKFFIETFENLNNLFNISLFNSMLVVNNVIDSITKNKSK